MLFRRIIPGQLARPDPVIANQEPVQAEREDGEQCRTPTSLDADVVKATGPGLPKRNDAEKEEKRVKKKRKASPRVGGRASSCFCLFPSKCHTR